MSGMEQPPVEAAQAEFSWGKAVWTAVVWVVAPLLLGWWLAGLAAPRPAVGVIRLRYDIWSLTTQLVVDQVALARENPRIQAVVLQIDSPGGEVTASQTLFLELQGLRKDMPVVGSIDSMAASGGYYAVVAADPIFAKPSSTIGNVGAWGFVPTQIGVSEAILATGPFKLTASNPDEFVRELDGIRQEFLATVASQRGDRLQIPLPELAQGLAYPGREALRFGLIDEIGSESDAIKKAAELAGIRDYEVIDLEIAVLEEWYGSAYVRALNHENLTDWVGAANPLTGERRLPPGVYLLYDVRFGRER